MERWFSFTAQWRIEPESFAVAAGRLIAEMIEKINKWDITDIVNIHRLKHIFELHTIAESEITRRVSEHKPFLDIGTESKIVAQVKSACRVSAPPYMKASLLWSVDPSLRILSPQLTVS